MFDADCKYPKRGYCDPLTIPISTKGNMGQRALHFVFSAAVTAAFIGGCSEAVPPPPVKQEVVKLTPEQEFAATLKKAEAGDVSAQNDVGKMYADGFGVPEDMTKATVWYQKAAEQGYARAQSNIARMYLRGKGVPEDKAKAIEWLQKAVAQGDATAQGLLGVIYRRGIGVPKDADKGSALIQMGVAQGNSVAQIELGVMYFRGEGVPEDKSKAVDLWLKAAEQGDASAQERVASCFRLGWGVPVDFAKAAVWSLKAAAQGEADSQYDAGNMYQHGSGVAADPVLAYAWHNLAASSTSKSSLSKSSAENERSRLENEMTPADLAEAQRLSSGWKKGQILVREGGSSKASASTPASAGNLSKKNTGTIFVISDTGQAITNRHVAGGCTELRVQGREGVAKLITDDAVNDLALVQIQGAVKDAAPITSDPGKLRQGEDIVVFGFPLNSVLSSGGNLTPGVVSALTGLGNNTNQIQITAPIQPGSSGSPVLNKKGEVVGVVSMKLSDSKMASTTGQIGQNVNFAVSGQTLKTFLDTRKVSYSTGSFFSREKSTADLADEARKWTLVVECWK